MTCWDLHMSVHPDNGRTRFMEARSHIDKIVFLKTRYNIKENVFIYMCFFVVVFFQRSTDFN